jgi:hypothetical protein
MQEMVDAEDGVFGEGSVQQPIQCLRPGEIFAEWLLDDDPASLQHAGSSQGIGSGEASFAVAPFQLMQAGSLAP